MAGHAGEFDAMARGWVHGPHLCLDPIYGEFTIAGQAARVAEAARAAGFTRYLVLGHSQGGVVALELARMYPDVVVAVVIVDAPVLVPAPIRTALSLFAALLHTPIGPALLRAFVRATFTAADAPEHRAGVLRRLAAVAHSDARRVVAAAFGFRAIDAFAALTVPSAYLRAEIPTRLDRLPVGVRGYDVSGAGHWVHLHRPDRLIAVLEELAAVGT